MVGLDELFQGAREELGLPEPQMRRYEVTRELPNLGPVEFQPGWLRRRTK
jgi:hypothetical protein